MLKAINALRFPAALLIVLVHTSQYMQFTPLGQQVYDNVLGNGAFSVDFFLILSGFLICLGYGEREHYLSHGQYKKFVAKRFAKVFPHYFFILICYLIYYWCTDPSNFALYFQQFLCVSTMMQTLIPHLSVNMLFFDVGWYISCIFILYLLTPFLLKCNRLIKTSIWKSLAGIAALLGLKVLFMYLATTRIQTPEISTGLWYCSPLSRFFVYAAGILLCNIYKKIREVRLNRTLATALEAVMLVGLGYSYLIRLWGEGFYCYDVVYFAFTGLSLLVFGLEQGWISYALSRKPFQVLGGISMDVYLVHPLLLRLGLPVFQTLSPIGDKKLFGFVGLMVLLAIAAGWLLSRSDNLVKGIKGKLASFANREVN